MDTPMNDCLLNNTTEIISDWLRPGPLLGYGLVNNGIKARRSDPYTMEIRRFACYN
jgi:hypothetical protein